MYAIVEYWRHFHSNPSFLTLLSFILLSVLLRHGFFNGLLCLFLLSVDVGAYCRKWIESQNDVCVRPRISVCFVWMLVSPETKEAIDKGIEKIEEIPKFYLDAEKKEKKEKEKRKEYWFGWKVRCRKKKSHKSKHKKSHKEKKEKKQKWFPTFRPICWILLKICWIKQECMNSYMQYAIWGCN